MSTCVSRTLSKHTYDKILKLRVPEEGESTRRWAREIALSFHGACSAAIFLFEAGWPDDGERFALERRDELAREPYTWLQDLASLAEAAGRRLVVVVCYRHLIRDILNDARSRAYGHAVKYYHKLDALDGLVEGHGSLGEHSSFVAELRRQHGRKHGFWGRLESENKQ